MHENCKLRTAVLVDLQVLDWELTNKQQTDIVVQNLMCLMTIRWVPAYYATNINRQVRNIKAHVDRISETTRG